MENGQWGIKSDSCTHSHSHSLTLPSLLLDEHAAHNSKTHAHTRLLDAIISPTRLFLGFAETQTIVCVCVCVMWADREKVAIPLLDCVGKIPHVFVHSFCAWLQSLFCGFCGLGKERGFWWDWIRLCSNGAEVCVCVFLFLLDMIHGINGCGLLMGDKQKQQALWEDH